MKSVAAWLLAVMAMALAACSRSDTTPAPNGPPSSVPDSVASPAESALERVIAFEDPAQCWPTPAFLALLDGLTLGDEAARPAALESVVLPTVAGVEFGQPRMIGNPDGYQIDVPVTGMWHGLRLTRISRWWAPDSDFLGFALHFADDREDVRRVVNGLGLMVPPEGLRESAAELPTAIWIDAKDGEASFNCSM